MCTKQGFSKRVLNQSQFLTSQYTTLEYNWDIGHVVGAYGLSFTEHPVDKKQNMSVGARRTPEPGLVFRLALTHFQNFENENPTALRTYLTSEITFSRTRIGKTNKPSVDAEFEVNDARRKWALNSSGGKVPNNKLGFAFPSRLVGVLSFSKA